MKSLLDTGLLFRVLHDFIKPLLDVKLVIDSIVHYSQVFIAINH
jgi:hypothetical protein